MKSLLILLVLWGGISKNTAENARCSNEGCYEVVKVFAELLEKKITETDAILAEAESELNEITFGNDLIFKDKIKEVDNKLGNLLNEFHVGVDGGDKTLMELINSVFSDYKNIEKRSEEIDVEEKMAAKNLEAGNKSFDNTKEVIREIQEEINRLMNTTTLKGPEALQDAFDRSEKFNSNSGQLNEILDEVKIILKDYEENLRNAKLLTEKAIEKFAKVSQQVEETMNAQEDVKNNLSGIEETKKSENELKNLKKLTDEALGEANKVFEDAFDLLSEISRLELIEELDEINKKVEELKNHSGNSKKSLQEFAEENEKFLDDMEKTIETAEKNEKKAFKLKEEIENLLENMTGIYGEALKAIADVDALIAFARKLNNHLEDFTIKVENSRESARNALEKLPEIIKKIEESEKIVGKLEEKLDEKLRVSVKAKEKITEAKEQMDKVLSESEEMKAQLDQLESDFEDQPEEVSKNDIEQSKISNEIDKLEKEDEEDSKLIAATQEKTENAKTKVPETDEKVEEALKKIQKLMDEIGEMREIDEEALNEFDEKLIKAENDLEESQLNEKLMSLKAERHEQTLLIEEYELEVAALEYQVSVIKKNAESLENRCFKRTRLEP